MVGILLGGVHFSNTAESGRIARKATERANEHENRDQCQNGAKFGGAKL